MISNKSDLKFYLAADKHSLGIKYMRPKVYDHIWVYQIYLRKSEYYRNTKKNILTIFMSKYYKYRKYKLGLLLGFDIGDNVFGPGLRINHFGNIVISSNAKIGMWCDIHQGVNIGVNNSKIKNDNLVPIIGHNVWIGPGVKAFAKIYIGNESVLGANSVIMKDNEASVTLAGIPAKIIKHSGTNDIDVAASPSRAVNFFLEHPEYLVNKDAYLKYFENVK
jgi:serine O-acetyltransferase